MDYIRRFHAKWCFISAPAFHPEKGCFNYDAEEAKIKRAFYDNADHTVLLLDHTRSGKPFSIWSCPWHSYPSSSTMDLFHISYRSYASCIMYDLFVIRRAYFPIEANYSSRRICSYPYSFL
ncbi:MULTISPECIES: hypothetical protein [Firmicutes]|uniref:DeoR-like transcriptional repressor C-terminal sensor domain-containing protein n=1 Tax=Clostridium innocuum TaxID=1522 RepID=A0AAP9MIG5_CLOIN|nr:hypothetical protein [[Clostridium] innocuum]MBU9114413.1 hypothetical protein [[Clostridium] innocuum]QJA05148.1 hypothetical protein G4D54_04180 [[Clostridium] innocuum]